MNREEKIETIKKGKFFVRGDVVVFAAALFLVAFFSLFAFFGRGEAAKEFSVYYKNQKIFTAPLGVDAEYVFYIEGETGNVCVYDGKEYGQFNIIRVSNGKVSVGEANCPDHICMAFGSIDSGEIICLPHYLKIVAEGQGLGTDV